MIVSHKHRFIFLKTHKTAGTSVEIALSRYCGRRDILTPISPEDEQLRSELGLAPQNHTFGLADYSLRDWGRLLLKRRPRSGLKFHNHMPARAVRRLLGARTWDRYFKFCFERNPWDKVISQFWFDNQGRPDFDDFVRHGELWSDFDLYTIDGSVAVDYLGRYENLDEELRALCVRLDIPFDGWLPRAKGGFRKDRRRPAELYTREQAEVVAARFAREIQLLGYRFV